MVSSFDKSSSVRGKIQPSKRRFQPAVLSWSFERQEGNAGGDEEQQHQEEVPDGPSDTAASEVTGGEQFVC